MTYSDLFVNVEPEGAGRGRFNYHLKLLREADLVEVDENLYRLTPRGKAAAVLLEKGLESPKPQKRWKLSDTVTGSLFGLAFIGITTLIAILVNVQKPGDLVIPVLAVGSPFLALLVLVHRHDGLFLTSPTKVSYFVRGALIVYSVFVFIILLNLLFQAMPFLAGPNFVVYSDVYPGGSSTMSMQLLPWLYLTPFLAAWLWVLGKERE
jgi:hypothetical protein